MHVMGMVPVSLKVVSALVRSLISGMHVKTLIARMIALEKGIVIPTLDNVHATSHLSNTVVLVVSSWIALLVVMHQVGNATAMMASASVKWASQVRNVSCLLGAVLHHLILRRLTGGLCGISQGGSLAPRVNSCMPSSVVHAMLSHVSILEAVLLDAKATRTFIRLGIAIMI